MAKRVLRYLRGTSDLGLVYRSTGSDEVLGYTDADYGGERPERRSTEGCVFMYAGAPIKWSSHLQRVTAASTCEAEYMAARRATLDALWMRKLTATVKGVPVREQPPLQILGDNQGALRLINNPCMTSGAKSKHIDTAFHVSKSRVKTGEVAFDYVNTKLMLADGLTKQQDGTLFKDHKELLGLG